MSDPVCPICKTPRKSGSASLTQWIATCGCQIASDGEEGLDIKSPDLCRQCGKRIGAGRSGSFTQFIFRSDICQCDIPRPFKDKLADSQSKPITDAVPMKESGNYPSTDADAESGIAVDPEAFPASRYTALAVLGNGAGSCVYLARDKILDKEVAIKILLKVDPRQLVAFQDEARATSTLKHPNIINVLDFGIISGVTPYMVLDYVDGRTLQSVLLEEGKLGWSVCAPVFEQICDALQYAHNRGVFHRDLKPGNILLTGDGGSQKAMIIDFGIAKIRCASEENSGTPTIAGTPLYLSPDAGRGKIYDARSEVYSLGCVLFECLAGRPPFLGESPLHTLSLHATMPPPRLPDDLASLSGLQSLLDKAMAKEQDDRFQNMDEFKSALARVGLDDNAVELKQTSDAIQAPRTKASLPVAIAIAAALIIGALSIGTLAFFRVKSNEAREKSIKEGRTIVRGGKKTDANGSNEEGLLYDEISPRAQRELSDLERKFIKDVKWERKGTSVTGRQVNDADFKSLVGSGKIEDILLTVESGATGTGFRYLSDQPLRSVDIRSPGFDDLGAMSVSQIKTITTLQINHSRHLSDKGIRHLVSLPALTRLDLRYLRPLPPHAILIASGCHSINELDLHASAPIRLDEVQCLKRMHALNTLDLSETSVGDEYIPYLIGLPLIRLSLDGTNVSDKGLKLLADMPTLRHLTVELSDEGITLKGLNRFKWSCPRCHVEITDQTQKAQKVFGAEAEKAHLHQPAVETSRPGNQ